MDPIHPILPHPVNIPPVMPSTGAGRIDRDGQRGGKPDQEARAKAQRRRREAAAEDTGGNRPGSHVDITA